MGRRVSRKEARQVALDVFDKAVEEGKAEALREMMWTVSQLEVNLWQPCTSSDFGIGFWVEKESEDEGPK